MLRLKLISSREQFRKDFNERLKKSQYNKRVISLIIAIRNADITHVKSKSDLDLNKILSSQVVQNPSMTSLLWDPIVAISKKIERTPDVEECHDFIIKSYHIFMFLIDQGVWANNEEINDLIETAEKMNLIDFAEDLKYKRNLMKFWETSFGRWLDKIGAKVFL
jgi:hypothetical protein